MATALETVAVSFDDAGITVAYPGEAPRSIAWDALTMVGIRTTDGGPFVEDVFWGLHGAHGAPALVYPGGADGAGELLPAMQRRLPGFDSRQVVDAMGSAGDAFFLVWKKAEEGGAGAA